VDAGDGSECGEEAAPLGADGLGLGVQDGLVAQREGGRGLSQDVNALIADALRTPFAGIGKPEPLRENLSGFWSRRIDDSNRLVCAVDAALLTVIACRYHD
jgi:toxin YoeB